jgi:microcystin-dependent protein
MRPTVTHDGFLVPNAATVSNPRMAEPDQIDFNAVANLLWGVVEGCLITVSGTTVSTLGGLVIINGQVMTLPAGTVQLGVGGSQDRFDLIVADISGTIKVIPGTPAVDPVFPDPPLNATVLAAVFCPSGSSAFTDNVIDKRVQVPKALLTRVATDSDLVRNLNGSGNYFRIDGGGGVRWADDTGLRRIAPATLQVDDNLNLAGDLAAGGSVAADSLTAVGLVQGSNLQVGTGSLPSSAALGSIFQHDSGRVYVRTSGGWKELATLAGAVPVGAILNSVEPPSVMVPLGWIPFDGRTVSEAALPSLFTLVALQPFISGVAPNRTMTLPNASGRVMMSTTGTPLAQGGANLNQISLVPSQMPKHRHNVRTTAAGGGPVNARTSRAGSHNHPVSGGAHGHPVTDPGHAHNAMDFFGNPSPVIALMWGGQNKIDALFNDRNHTYSVEPMDWTRPALTGITVGSSGSEHYHTLGDAGDHDHPITIDPVTPHVHPITEDEVGTGAPIDITPAFLTSYTYIRS